MGLAGGALVGVCLFAVVYRFLNSGSERLLAWRRNRPERILGAHVIVWRDNLEWIWRNRLLRRGVPNGHAGETSESP
jgi:hypothetical protein